MPLSPMDVIRLYSIEHGAYNTSCYLAVFNNLSVGATQHFCRSPKPLHLILLEANTVLLFAACVCRRYSLINTFHFPRSTMQSPFSETALPRPFIPAELACTFELDILRMASIHGDECAICVVSLQSVSVFPITVSQACVG
jgi:hypothetical protein